MSLNEEDKQKNAGITALVMIILIAILAVSGYNWLNKDKVEKCEALSGLDRDSCYFDEATATDNSDMCNQIENWQLKLPCKEVTYAN